jgi:serine/threonine protein kinase
MKFGVSMSVPTKSATATADTKSTLTDTKSTLDTKQTQADTKSTQADIKIVSIKLEPIDDAKVLFHGTEQPLTYERAGGKGEFETEKIKTAFDLIRRLLRLNPANRLTAAEALNHPLFTCG